MSRESMSEHQPDVLLPPARTRAVGTAGGPEPARPLLPPVRSGFRSTDQLMETAGIPPFPEPAATPSIERFDVPREQAGEPVEYEIAVEEVTIELTGFAEFETDDPSLVFEAVDVDDEQTADVEGVKWYDDDRSAPWEEVTESADLVFESDALSIDDLVLEDEGVEETVAAEIVEVREPEPEVRQAPPPLSPWDLGTAAMSPEETDRAARARAEWESLGQALSDSLNAAGPLPEDTGSHGYELTDEKAAELDAGTGSPFGGYVMAVSSSGSGDLESPMSELARRLEAFARSLREEGASALNRAQTGDDRFDALLASIAAGFLAGRGE